MNKITFININDNGYPKLSDYIKDDLNRFFSDDDDFNSRFLAAKVFIGIKYEQFISRNKSLYIPTFSTFVSAFIYSNKLNDICKSDLLLELINEYGLVSGLLYKEKDTFNDNFINKARYLSVSETQKFIKENLLFSNKNLFTYLINIETNQLHETSGDIQENKYKYLVSFEGEFMEYPKNKFKPNYIIK